MICQKLALTLLCALSVSVSALAQSAHTPAPGTPERAAIMDALRVPAKKDLGMTVIFKVDRLRVAGDWAYARVAPTKPNGDAIDFSKTKFREQMEADMFDPLGEALLHRENNEWKMLEWVFGGTDSQSSGWSSTYRFPKSLLE